MMESSTGAGQGLSPSGLLLRSGVKKHSLKPSACQLRQLWEFDNACAARYCGAPLRVCSSKEPSDEPNTPGFSPQDMGFMISAIKKMWQKNASMFEVFHEDSHPELGWRLRVKADFPISINLKKSDGFVFGWRAGFEKECASEHLYLRSDLQKDEYMGGPISFCNWVDTSSNCIIALQESHGSGKNLVKLQTKRALKPGSEVVWDYGLKQAPCFNDIWHNQECCSTKSEIIQPKQRLQDEIFENLCTLCGEPFRQKRERKEIRKAQRKVHFINSHTDFLGSDWDGLGQFDQSKFKIDFKLALMEAERLNNLISRLESDGWKVTPPCAVLTKSELNAAGDFAIMAFHDHCQRLRRLGCVVLRGRIVPSVAEDLLPIRPSKWNILFSEEDKPTRVYSMDKVDKLANQALLEEFALQDIKLAINSIGSDDMEDGN